MNYSAMTLADPLPIRPLPAEVPAETPVQLEVTPPGSKSITNRALVLAALAGGVTQLDGALFSRDTRVMCAALRALGFDVEPDETHRTIRVHGRAGSIPAARATLDVGNAGTAARFLTALLALHPAGEYALDGDDAMRVRPMRGLLDALRSQGAEAFAPDGSPAVGFPFSLKTHGLRGGEIVVDASASSQILSALLLVAPFAQTPAHIRLAGSTVSEPFVEMTRRMVDAFNKSTKLAPAHSPVRRYSIEPDATAASYFLALPLAVPAARVLVRGLGAAGTATIAGEPAAPLQGDLAFTEILRALGLEITGTTGGLLSGTAGTFSPLPASFNFTAISDTFLTLAALAPLLPARVRIYGVAHARRQETDRLLAVATELERLGQRVSPSAAELRADPSLGEITIFPDRAALLRASAGGPVVIQTYEDHRLAMSFAILGLHDLHGDGRPWLAIADPRCCSKTFPEFFDTAPFTRD